MAQGIVNGVSTTIGQFQEIQHILGIQFSRQRKRWFRAVEECGGDIDLILQFGRHVELSKLFPSDGSVIFHPRPSATQSVTAVILEIRIINYSKRDCQKKIDQFLKFYSTILDPAIDFNQWTVTNDAFDSQWMQLLKDLNAPLLFVFNGFDLVDAHNYLLKKCPTLSIHGHAVVTVFAMSDSITKWEEIARKDEAIMKAEMKITEAEMKANEKAKKAAEAKLKSTEAEMKVAALQEEINALKLQLAKGAAERLEG